MSYLDDIRKARIEVWEQMPLEVGKLGQNQQTMQPAGRAFYAESETRVLTEILYTFLDALEQLQISEETFKASLSCILSHFAERLEGWYGLGNAALMTAKVKSVISTAQSDEIQEVVRELILYMSRLNLWLDLLIPWNDINEMMRGLNETKK